MWVLLWGGANAATHLDDDEDKDDGRDFRRRGLDIGGKAKTVMGIAWVGVKMLSKSNGYENVSCLGSEKRFR